MIAVVATAFAALRSVPAGITSSTRKRLPDPHADLSPRNGLGILRPFAQTASAVVDADRDDTAPVRIASIARPFLASLCSPAGLRVPFREEQQDSTS